MRDERSYTLIVCEEDEGERLDTFLGDRIPELSRSRIQKGIRAGEVMVDGKPASKAAKRVREGERIELRFSPPRPLEIAAEKIPLDIRYEDDDLLVVNKAAGMVVHPAPGHERGTLVNALLAHCGVLSGIGGVQRPGIVHRLDSGTTGLLVVAKNDAAHISLGRQLMERKVRRVYQAVVWGEMPAAEGIIDAPIGRSPRDRKRMAVVRAGGRGAVTRYYALDSRKPFQYIKVKLETGRTHQIRVHCSHVGHPVLGDPLYGGRRVRRGSLAADEIERAERALSIIDRQALHAGELEFMHPRTGEMVLLTAEPPADLESILELCAGRGR